MFLRKIFSKLIELLIALIVLASLSFVVVRALPGGPFDDEALTNSSVRDLLDKQYGLGDPLPKQYLDYMKNFFLGDFGVSFVRPEVKIMDRIKSVIQVSLFLNIIALLIVTLFAPLLAGAALLIPSLDFAIRQLCIVLISLPSLFLAPLLIWCFAVYLGWFPVALLGSPMHWVLPVATLSLRPLAQLTRVLLRALDNQKAMDYVRAARARGLGEVRILFKHILPNSLIPVLAYYPILAVGLLSGTFLVELLFAIPGIGSEFVLALNERDYPMLGGLIFIVGSLYIVFSFLTEAFMLKIDPRLIEENRAD